MNIKQVIVIRKDLNMRKGKMVAQGSHASIAFLTRRLENEQPLTPVQKLWLDHSFAKICVSVDSEQELLDIQKQAQQQNIECHLVTDEGRTEFNGTPTHTCLALGPDYDYVIDPVTKHLKLL